MSTAKHTALPLTASTVWAQGNGETTANFVLDANGKTVAWAAKPEDAALIVQAVNAHLNLTVEIDRQRARCAELEELLTATRDALDYFGGPIAAKGAP